MSFLFNGQRREWSAGLSVQQLLLQGSQGFLQKMSWLPNQILISR